jgi:hypothetical protein
MVKPAEKAIYIQNHEGERAQFDPVVLQTRLINCFLTAGLRESSYMAEDIALAVEYTLLNTGRPEPVFGQGELAAAVIRMLEETGFPEIAALFRQSGGDRHVALDATPEAVAGFLRKFLACSEIIFDRVVREVTRAVEVLGIGEADPHLYLELARHYERKFAIEGITGGTEVRLRGRTSASREEVAAVLPPEVRALTSEGVLRVGEVNEIFSRIRFFFMMKPFARKFKLVSPVTEMEVEPLLFRMSRVLELGRAAIESALQPAEPLPVQLTIPDMSVFVAEYFGAEREKSRKLTDELARTLSFELKDGVYKLTVN